MTDTQTWNPWKGDVYPAGLKPKRKKVAVLMPLYGGKVPMELVEQQDAFKSMCADAGIDYVRLWLSDSHIDRARTILTHWAMWIPDVTHMLWIDGDIIIPDPADLLDLILSGLPYVGITYPKHHIDFSKVVSTARQKPDLPEPLVLSAGMDFVVRIPPPDPEDPLVSPATRQPDGSQTLSLKAKRYMPVSGTGTGCLLQTRHALRLTASHPSVPVSTPPPSGWPYPAQAQQWGVLEGARNGPMPFVWSSGLDPEGKCGVWLSEDYWNARIYTLASGAFPHIDVTKSIAHTTSIPLMGCYGHQLLQKGVPRTSLSEDPYGPVLMRAVSASKQEGGGGSE